MKTTDEAGSLQSQIDAVEARVYERRSRVVAELRGIAHAIRAGMTAPGTVLIAVGVGVLVEQGSHGKPWSLVPVMRGVGVTRRMLVTLTALVRSLDAASAP